MDLYSFAIRHDWPVLTPIVICSVVAVAVTIERALYYFRNRMNMDQFLHRLEDALDKGFNPARMYALGQRGIVSEVAAEGGRIAEEHPDRFDTMYDVAASLATRQLDRNLPILGTIATISPYLGLFGTVVRILLTFGEMAQTSTGGNASSIMFGIGSALIATAFGLGVAIFSVAMNNYLRTTVERFVADFDLVKLVYLGALGAPRQASVRGRRVARSGEEVEI